eukprot:TRINITY_DN36984_c0_g1_i1.p1 TRINITY_DN36984_c0_g1~~TRINITY_DN36984_c0_g1_i1.p1  ORF type:complete len:164 (-),score=30.76 TRINITY_DN36984_c0_g1_i1:83-574(-)
MELLRVKPRMEWEDSDDEGVSNGAYGLKGTIFLTLEAGDLLSESDESTHSDRPEQTRSLMNTIEMAGNSVDTTGLSMNIFDPSAGCWKHFEKLAAAEQQLVSLSGRGARTTTLPGPPQDLGDSSKRPDGPSHSAAVSNVTAFVERASFSSSMRQQRRAEEERQ